MKTFNLKYDKNNPSFKRIRALEMDVLMDVLMDVQKKFQAEFLNNLFGIIKMESDMAFYKNILNQLREDTSTTQ